MKLALAAVAAVLATVVISAVLAARGSDTTYIPLDFDGAFRAYPMDTLGDVGAHADAVVIATVLAEAENLVEEDPDGEGRAVTRRVTLRVDRRLWEKENSTPLPETFDTAGGVWHYSKGVRTPVWLIGEVGKQHLYVVVENTDPDDSYRWHFYGSVGAPIMNGRTPTQINSEKPWFAEIRGKTPDELERLFAAKLGS